MQVRGLKPLSASVKMNVKTSIQFQKASQKAEPKADELELSTVFVATSKIPKL